MTRLSSLVIPADEVQAMVYAAIEDVFFFMDAIVTNQFYFISIADMLQGVEALSAASLDYLLRGAVHGGPALDPTLNDDGFRSGSAFLLANVNSAGRLAGLIDPSTPGHTIAPIAFYDLPVIQPGLNFKELDERFRIVTDHNWNEERIYRAASLYQGNTRFKFCSRVAGGDRFVYWKRS